MIGDALAILPWAGFIVWLIAADRRDRTALRRARCAHYARIQRFEEEGERVELSHRLITEAAAEDASAAANPHRSDLHEWTAQ